MIQLEIQFYKQKNHFTSVLKQFDVFNATASIKINYNPYFQFSDQKPKIIIISCIFSYILFIIRIDQQQTGPMRSKQRKTYHTSEDFVKAPLTPNPYRKENHSKQQLDQSKTKNILPKHMLNSRNLAQNSKNNEKLDILMKQNAELRKQIVELKVHQFYHFDDKKLKDLIVQMEQLRKQIKKHKEDLEEMQLENDFLRRTNIQLKSQLQNELQIKRKDQNIINHQTSHRTLKFGNSKNCDQEVSQLTTKSGSYLASNHCHNTTLEETLDCYKSYGDNKNLPLKRGIIDKCISPRRKEANSPSMNEYLLFKKQKQKVRVGQNLESN